MIVSRNYDKRWRNALAKFRRVSYEEVLRYPSADLIRHLPNAFLLQLTVAEPLWA